MNLISNVMAHSNNTLNQSPHGTIVLPLPLDSAEHTLGNVYLTL